MKNISLEWNVLPACMFEVLSQREGEESFYNPILGSGIYVFIHANGKRYQVYYIGKAKEIGNRLMQHYLEYAGSKKNGLLVAEESRVIQRGYL